MKTIALLALSLTAGICHADGYLTIGDPAPSLSHVTWLKGGPVGEFEKGKVYVVEFWATWCTPCKANIPNLTALAKKYEGQVTIAGIDIWESTDKRDNEYMKRVADFVEKEGGKMAYTVGADDLGSDIANAWMKSAGEGGIPESFVIGKDGKIAWMGHAQGLDEVLPQVIAGTFDVKAARDRRTTDVEMIRPVKEAMTAHQYAKALSLIESLSAKHPNMTRFYDYDRYTAYTHTDLPKTKELTQQILKGANGDIGAYQMVSSVYATESNLTPDAYRYGLSLIKEALAKKDREYLFLSMESAVQAKLKNHSDALLCARMAVAAAEKDSHAPAPFVEFLRRNVKVLEAAK